MSNNAMHHSAAAVDTECHQSVLDADDSSTNTH